MAGRLPDPAVGYGSIKIGMPVTSLKNSDLVSPSIDWARVLHPADSGCAYAPLALGGRAVVQPDRQAVVAIMFAHAMETSKGIGIGSSVTAFHAAYPTAPGAQGVYRVPITSSIHYEFDFGSDHRVAGIVLAWDKQACFD